MELAPGLEHHLSLKGDSRKAAFNPPQFHKKSLIYHLGSILLWQGIWYSPSLWKTAVFFFPVWTWITKLVLLSSFIKTHQLKKKWSTSPALAHHLPEIPGGHFSICTHPCPCADGRMQVMQFACTDQPGDEAHPTPDWGWGCFLKIHKPTKSSK